MNSNNEAEYATITMGLEWCLENNIQRVNIFGESMLLIKQIQGIWACKNDKLATRLRHVQGLMKKLKHVEVHFIPHGENQLADSLASESMKECMIGEIKFQEPAMQGKESLQDIMCFLETRQLLDHLTKGQQDWLAKKAVRYKLINEDLY